MKTFTQISKRSTRNHHLRSTTWDTCTQSGSQAPSRPTTAPGPWRMSRRSARTWACRTTTVPSRPILKSSWGGRPASREERPSGSSRSASTRTKRSTSPTSPSTWVSTSFTRETRPTSPDRLLPILKERK